MKISRRSFCTAAAATLTVAQGQVTEVRQAGIHARFLGTGGAGWKPGRARRHSSILLDGRILIDFTPCAFEMLPIGCRPEAIFYTHSHGDHYNPEAAVQLGVKRVYCQETWSDSCRAEMAAASAKLNQPAPEVISLPFGQPVTEAGLTFTGVPANHCTTRLTDGVPERTSLYLVEKGQTRLLYATDTGGIPGEAARYVGIDYHIREGKRVFPHIHPAQPITAFVMEATMWLGCEDDFRIYVHSSVDTVERTIRVMKKTGRYVPPPGQTAYLTHMGVGLPKGATTAQLDAQLSPDLRAAYDGLEVTFY